MGPCDAHPARQRRPAVRTGELPDLHRRDRLDAHEHADGEHAGRAATTKAEKLFYLGQIMENSAAPFPPDDVRRVPARNQRHGRQGRGALGREDVGALPRHPQAVPRPEGHIEPAYAPNGSPSRTSLGFYVWQYATRSPPRTSSAESDGGRRGRPRPLPPSASAPAGPTIRLQPAQEPAGSRWRRRNPTG